MTPLKPGDKVKRAVDVFDFSKGYKYGTVVDKYSYFSETLKIFYPELYAVRWNNQKEIRKGYLRHGLEKCHTGQL